MKYEYSFRKMFLIIFGFALIFTANLAKAEDIESAPIWNCIELLDSQTSSDLNGYERFFSGLFQLPNEYELASETEKKQSL